MKPRGVIAAAVVCLLVGACSPGSDPPTSAPVNEPGASSDGPNGTAATPRGGKDDGKGGSGEAPGGGKGSGPDEVPGSSAGKGPGSDPRDDPPAARSARHADPRDDLDSSGDPPDYVDLTSVEIESGSQAVTFTISGAGAFPGEMPDLETNALVGVGLDKSGDEYFFQGEGSTSGWNASMSRNGRTTKYRGRFTVSGNRMIFAIPWADLGGNGPFRWSVDSSWTRTTTLRTFYAFDRVPQFERQRFPSG